MLIRKACFSLGACPGNYNGRDGELSTTAGTPPGGFPGCYSSRLKHEVRIDGEELVKSIRKPGEALILLSISLAFMSGAALAAADSRDGADTWNLTDIYTSPAAWEEARAALESEIETADRCRGRLGESAAMLKKCLNDFNRLRKGFQRMFAYAAMSSDQDIRNQEAMARRQAAGLLATRFSQKVAFGRPELLAVGDETLNRFLKEDRGLARHRPFIADTLRRAEHTLSEEGERVIAATGNIARTPFSIYSTLANAEIPWPTVTLSRAR